MMTLFVDWTYKVSTAMAFVLAFIAQYAAAITVCIALAGWAVRTHYDRKKARLDAAEAELRMRLLRLELKAKGDTDERSGEGG